MAFPSSAFITGAANGALADTLIDDFGRAAMNAGTQPIPSLDWRLCLVSLDWGSAGSAAIRVFFAEQAGVAAELQFELVNLTTQYFVWPSFEVPRSSSGLPYTMRITKAAGNATIGYRYVWQKAGSC